MKEHKIFKPDILMQDYIKSSWIDNVKTLNGKLPINQFLKARGIWALEISPLFNKDWYGFGLPVNKNWEAERFDNDIALCFSVYTESPISISVSFQNASLQNSDATVVNVDPSGDFKAWNTYIANSPFKDIRMVLFSGSSNKTPDFVIKDIVLKPR